MQNLIGKRVRVHLNLHRGDFTIADPKTGNVITNVDTVTLSGVTFKVSEATRQRIITHRRRRVCAYALGRVVAFEAIAPTTRVVSFNPYKAATFYDETGAPVHSTERVTFANKVGYLPDEA